MSGQGGEQLELFTEAPEPATPTRRPRPGRAQTAAVRDASNDIDLVTQVLTTAVGPGYLVEDTAAGTRVWCARGPVDPRGELRVLERVRAGEAVMVAQLIERGWLHRGARAQTRTAIERGRSSGRRRVEVEVHALSVPTAARHTLSRWSVLAAVPVQRDDPAPS